MSRIFLTGATGYIGSQLARYLLPNHEIFLLARTPLQTKYLFDIQDRVGWYAYDGDYASVSDAINHCRPDLVYHLATYYTTDHGQPVISELLQSNIMLGGYLLEAMAQYGCNKLVYTTTITEYGICGTYQPRTLYAATKRAFSDLAEYYVTNNLLRMVTLVLSDTYGPGDVRPKVLNLLKRATFDHRKLKFISSGNQVYDAVYIDDVVAALYLAGVRLLKCEGENIQHYQVCASNPLSLKETVARFETVNQVICDVQWGEKKAEGNVEREPLRIYPVVPGWKETVSLDEGLRYIWEI